jgi:hypothetical protein
MRSLAIPCQLTDVWSHKYPGVEFNTHHPGRKRINYVLVSPDLIPGVKSVGYFPFKYRGKSDHRSIYIDFDTQVLFGNATHKLATAIQQGFKSTDPFAVTTYLTSAGKHARSNNLFTLSATLATLDSPDHALAEKINDILGQTMLHGGKQCRPRRPSWWSRKLHRFRLWKSILERAITGYRTNGEFTDTLQRLMKTHRLQDMTLPLSMAECRKSHSLVKTEVIRLETFSSNQRADEQVAAAEIYDQTGQKEQATLLREIRNSEAMSNTWRLFKNIRTEKGNSTLNQIQVPHDWPPPHTPFGDVVELSDPKAYASQPDPQWRTVTFPDEINYYIFLRNQRHFGQAQGTPFTVAPLSHTVDWAASSSTAEAILEGTFDDHDLDRMTQSVIQECKAKTDLDSITGQITTAEFKGKFKTWRESTSTSPSGRHLSMYKALLARTSATDYDTATDLHSIQVALIQVHVNLINYCLRFRYSLRHWKEIVNVMILKSVGEYYIHQLRVIHLYEADFNFILGIKWKQLLHHAEATNILHGGQYGGRPGREATTLTFIEELKTDICYASRKPLINFDNDAASCYDRIIADIASLVSRSHGQHRDVYFVHAETLQEATYRLKTAMGVTDELYQHCTAYPIYGTGQGSGNSPVIWVFISSVIFKCHEKCAKGATFESPDKSVTIKLYMVGFVDDSTGQVNDCLSDDAPPLDTLVSLMAHDAQLWNDLLHVSGGLLEVSKCSYHIVYFSFQPNGLPFMTSGLQGPDLNLTSSVTSEPIHVKKKSVYECHKTLGHQKSPAGNSNKHLHQLIETAIQLAQQLALSPATRIQAMLFFWSIYIATVRFSLPQCFYTKKRLDTAQGKSIPLIIAKSGYMCTTAYSILFGPKSLGGAGFIRWFTLQGEGQVMLFLKHWRANDTAGRLLRIAVAWVQYQSGVGIPIFANPELHIPYLESRWLPSLRQFLAHIHGQLLLDKTYIAPLQCTNDEYIMTRVLATQIFTDFELHVINCCQLYLNVITISDLVQACGREMDPAIAQHEPSSSSTSKYHKTLQTKPPDWRHWDRIMSIWFASDNTLRLPLGTWLASGHSLRRTWSAHYDHDDDYVYLKTSDGFAKCSVQNYHYVPTEISDWQLTAQSYPIRIDLFATSPVSPSSPSISPISPMFRGAHDAAYILHSPLPPLPTPPLLSVSTTFDQYIHTIPVWEQTLFASLEFLVPPYELATLLMQADLAPNGATLFIHFVSDGSQIVDTTSFGWCLSLSDGTRLACCSGPGHGPGTSHRAEGYGVLSAVCFVSRLQHFTDTSDPWPLHFPTDNKGLLTRIAQRQAYAANYANATLAPDWDLIEEIVSQLCALPVLPKFKHVKGHQDDHVAYHEPLPQIGISSKKSYPSYVPSLYYPNLNM